ncbi:hypothetical protein CLHUN_39740 [Ruminiclostridium hungatei]|uniref:DUF1848 domain-containing protein n=1 Tax=Ruminiclostridium hungatei TaxID=48256 RepID=A0A1V4SFY8_RUMHU|nr:DUF1848 domain-containing protein [Ruminiclostridium hungatei]OPX42187.1 hypothetical protein CLHUN_39740 [Ruminiclostridium hungatei]
MIISASRRTDIPTYYSDWFFNRIKDRFLLVRNPMNIHQVSRIDLSPEVIDCIVFWSKNPKPMLERLDELKNYKYYFQFSLNSYGKDVEQNVPSKNDEVIDTFRRLSDKIGAEKVIWRYDPILINPIYTIDYHIAYFEKLAQHLKDYTQKCTISFIDFYSKIKKNIEQLDIVSLTYNEKEALAGKLFEIASGYGLKLDTCAEGIELSHLGIGHAKCVDDELISKIIGCPLKADKDKNQRPECGCVSSVDIGMYNTCLNGCKYCYANHSSKVVNKHSEKYAPDSPLLCSTLGPEDIISHREAKSVAKKQLDLI